MGVVLEQAARSRVEARPAGRCFSSHDSLQLKPRNSSLCNRETHSLGSLCQQSDLDQASAKRPLLPVSWSLGSLKGYGASWVSEGTRDALSAVRTAEPLQRWLSANARFQSGREQQKAFARMKRAAVNATHPQPRAPSVIDGNVSIWGLGAALAQPDENGKTP